MKIPDASTSMSRLRNMICLCAFLACMTPRYIATFKIHMGINISLYTVAVVATWLVFGRRLRFYRRIECYFFLIWFMFVVLSIWRAKQLGAWAYYVDWTLTSILYAQLLYTSDIDGVYDGIMKAMRIAMYIHLVVGLIEITRKSYFFSVSIEGRYYYGRVPVSIFHNPNDYVTLLITVAPFLLYAFFQSKTLLKKAFFIVMIGFTAFMIMRSESRSAFFAMLILAGTLIYLAFKKSTVNKILVILGVPLAVMVVYVIPAFRTRVLKTFTTNRIDLVSTDLARVNLIKNGMHFLRKTHGFGVGAGNLHYWLDNYAVYNIGKLRFLHNWYVELLVTFGIVFFIVYIVLHASIIIKLVKGYDPADKFWNLNNTMLISFICFSIVSIASSSNIYSEWIWMYYVFVTTYTMFSYNPQKAVAPNRRLVSTIHGA